MCFFGKEGNNSQVTTRLKTTNNTITQFNYARQSNNLQKSGQCISQIKLRDGQTDLELHCKLKKRIIVTQNTTYYEPIDIAHVNKGIVIL